MNDNLVYVSCEYMHHECLKLLSSACTCLCPQIPFGILGADRDDCDGDKCDPTIDTDYGSPIWDENVQDISNE